MIDVLPAQEDLVVDALRECAGAVEPAGYRRWCVALDNGQMSRMNVRMEDGWLLLNTPLSDLGNHELRDSECFWKLLEWNAAMPGGVKFTLAPADSLVQLQAEIPIDDELDPTERVRQAYAGFQEGVQKFYGNKWTWRAFARRWDGRLPNGRPANWPSIWRWATGFIKRYLSRGSAVWLSRSSWSLCPSLPKGEIPVEPCVGKQ